MISNRIIFDWYLQYIYNIFTMYPKHMNMNIHMDTQMDMTVDIPYSFLTIFSFLY